MKKLTLAWCFTLATRYCAFPGAKRLSALINTNTAYGDGALQNPSFGGTENSAFGFDALQHDTVGYDNTATGAYALMSNASGAGNTATGAEALLSNRGSVNTATGWNALESNTNGSE